MGRYRTVNVDLNRQYRNDLNQNFTDIERDFVKAESDIARVEAESKERDNLMAGTDVEVIIKRIDTSATNAELQSVYAKNQGDYAKLQGDYALEQGTYAQSKGDYAEEKAILADQAAANANLEANNLSQLKIDVTTATQNANTATENANTATTNAKNAGTYATTQGDYAKAQGDAAKAVVDGTGLIKQSDIGELVAGFNESGQVLDKNGNVVEGKVKSVNNATPDGTGNITIYIPTRTSELTNDSGFITSAPTTASQISIADASNLFTATNVEAALSELFTNVSDGKQLIATAITDKGVVTSGSDSFQTMADNISSLNVAEPDDTTNAPGRKTLLAGTILRGYFGTVPSSQLITGDALASLVGVSTGTSQHSTTDWLKFAYKGKIQFISMKPIRHTISWNSLDSTGCVFGKTVTIGGLQYKVRLIKGSLTDPTKYQDSDRGAKGSEWNDLILPLHEQAVTKSWAYPAYVDSNIPDWGTRFTDADLLTHISRGNGSASWCQETRLDDSTHRIVHGYNGVSYVGSYASHNADSNTGWRPVLEVL